MDSKVSLSKKAYRRIKDLIISINLAPGKQIDEFALAKELGIGRTPIREAILQLAGEGLLVSLPGRGHCVKAVDLNDIKALFEALLISEKAAAYLAAERITEAEIEALKEINVELNKAMTERDYLAVTKLNGRLHRAIYAAARNPYLYSSLNQIQGLSQRLAYLCFINQSDARELDLHNKKVSHDHEMFIELLEKGDGLGLVEVISRHVELFHQRICNYINPGGLNLDRLLP